MFCGDASRRVFPRVSDRKAAPFMLGLGLAIEGNFDPQPSQTCGDWRRRLRPNEAKRVDTMCSTMDWHSLPHSEKQHPMLPSCLVLRGDAVGDALATLQYFPWQGGVLRRNLRPSGQTKHVTDTVARQSNQPNSPYTHTYRLTHHLSSHAYTRTHTLAPTRSSHALCPISTAPCTPRMPHKCPPTAARHPHATAHTRAESRHAMGPMCID